MFRSITSVQALIVPCLLLLFSSCQNIYAPTVVNQPLIHKKGQVQVSGHAGTNGLDAQAAGSPAENIVLLLNYNSYTPEGDNDSLSEPWITQEVIEFGGGYYQPLGDDGRGVVELIGGYGNGTFEDPYPVKETGALLNFEPQGDPIVKANYHKFFFQPGIGIRHKVFDAGFSSRVSMVDHYGFEAYKNGGVFKVPYDPGPDIFWEPALTARVGYKLVKFQTQFGLSIPLHGSPNYWGHPLWFGVGIHLDLEPDYF